MTAGTDPGTACVVCLAAFDTRSGAHRPTCSGRCRSRLFRLRRRKTVWNGAWLAGRRDVIGACSLRPRALVHATAARGSFLRTTTQGPSHG